MSDGFCDIRIKTRNYRLFLRQLSSRTLQFLTIIFQCKGQLLKLIIKLCVPILQINEFSFLLFVFPIDILNNLLKTAFLLFQLPGELIIYIILILFQISSQVFSLLRRFSIVALHCTYLLTFQLIVSSIMLQLLNILLS